MERVFANQPHPTRTPGAPAESSTPPTHNPARIRHGRRSICEGILNLEITGALIIAIASLITAIATFVRLGPERERNRAEAGSVAVKAAAELVDDYREGRRELLEALRTLEEKVERQQAKIDIQHEDILKVRINLAQAYERITALETELEIAYERIRMLEAENRTLRGCDDE